MTPLSGDPQAPPSVNERPLRQKECCFAHDFVCFCSRARIHVWLSVAWVMRKHALHYEMRYSMMGGSEVQFDEGISPLSPKKKEDRWSNGVVCPAATPGAAGWRIASDGPGVWADQGVVYAPRDLRARGSRGPGLHRGVFLRLLRLRHACCPYLKGCVPGGQLPPLWRNFPCPPSRDFTCPFYTRSSSEKYKSAALPLTRCCLRCSRCCRCRSALPRAPRAASWRRIR